MSKSAASILRRLCLLAVVCSLPLLAEDQPVTFDGSVGTHGSGEPAAPKRLPQRSETYGTTAESYIRIDASEMDPITSANTYSGINNFQLRYLTNVAGLGLEAPIHLPSGALITYVELDYYDNSAVGEVQAAIGVCGFTGQLCILYVGDQNGCSDAPFALCSGNAATPGYSYVGTDMSGDAITVDNYSNRYVFAVGNTTNDGSTALSQIIIGYVLQVSPAPGVATFLDVPTSSPQFQFVEALVAAGITAGCGGNNYCPNNPVTRGQMAVFLAKALGLQFP